MFAVDFLLDSRKGEITNSTFGNMIFYPDCAKLSPQKMHFSPTLALKSAPTTALTPHLT